MRTFPVKRLYVCEDVEQDARAVRRARRLARGLGVADTAMVSRAEADKLALGRPAAVGGAVPPRTGSFDYSAGWTVLLDTSADVSSMGPRIARTTYRDASQMFTSAGVCQSALELHAAFGCYHRCAYCFCDPFFHIGCDLEALADRIPGYLARYPKQQLFKFDNFTDTIALEPEYGASELLVPLFGKTSDRYLLLYTKSDNVDHLLGLPHNGHTIVNWSFSPLTQSRTVEVNAPDMHARIAAMKACQGAGYPVRVRLSPLVSLEGWREEVPPMLDALFADVRPDVITLDILGWCLPEALAEAMDTSRFEEAWRREIESGMGTANRNAGKFLFSHERRQEALAYMIDEIRRRTRDIPISICNESRSMWAALQDRLGAKPERYVCCCGPDSVPGNPLLAGPGTGRR